MELIEMAVADAPSEFYDLFLKKHMGTLKLEFINALSNDPDFQADALTFKCSVFDRIYPNITIDPYIRAHLEIVRGEGTYHTTIRKGRAVILLPGVKSIDLLNVEPHVNPVNGGHDFGNLEDFVFNYEGLPDLDEDAIRTAVITQNLNVVGPYARFKMNVPYSMREVSLDQYLSWDFSSPLSFGGPGEIDYAVAELVVPYCVISASTWNLVGRLAKIRQQYCPVWPQHVLDDMFVPYDSMLSGEALSVTSTLSETPQAISLRDLFDTRLRY
jgi:hypothetical protein